MNAVLDSTTTLRNEFFDYAAIIAIWDPKHPETADSFHKFLALASAAKIHNILAIYPKESRWKDKPGMEPQLLFKKDDGTLYVEMEFTMDKKSCLKIAERILCLWAGSVDAKSTAFTCEAHAENFSLI